MAKRTKPGSSISAKPSAAKIKRASRDLQLKLKRIGKIASGAVGIIGARNRRAAQLGIVLEIARRHKDEPAWAAAIRKAYKAQGIRKRQGAGSWMRLVKLCIPGPAATNFRNAKLIAYASRNGWSGDELERRLIRYKGLPGLGRKYGWKKLVPKSPGDGVGR